MDDLCSKFLHKRTHIRFSYSPTVYYNSLSLSFSFFLLNECWSVLYSSITTFFSFSLLPLQFTKWVEKNNNNFNFERSIHNAKKWYSSVQKLFNHLGILCFSQLTLFTYYMYFRMKLYNFFSFHLFSQTFQLGISWRIEFFTSCILLEREKTARKKNKNWNSSDHN